MEKVKEGIANLVEKYDRLKKEDKIKDYNEAQTRNEFIEPLFELLGWDMRNLNNDQEVTTEENISGKRIDLAFRINGLSKFFLEAKSMKSDLDVESYAKQAIRYSWNKGINYAVLTDFESIKIFNAQAQSKLLLDKLIFEIPCHEYVSDFERIWLLSKESFSKNALDVYSEKYGKKLKKLTVNEKLLLDFKKGREILTESFSRWNKNMDKETLDEGVQRILDRLVFIRVLEDRGLEDPILRPLARDWENDKIDRSGNKQLFHLLIDKFRELDGIYNSNLFVKHACEDWEEYGDAVKEVIELLYGNDVYAYDFKEIPADILGGVYESYLGYIAQNPINEGHKKGKLFDLDDKNDIKIKSRQKRKEHGIYYTPRFIVDYIVKNALGEKLKEIGSMAELKKIKVLDPACGSGSFLTKALETINAKYKDFGNKGDQDTKTEIVLSNIYGVDLDSQATELAKLNLLLDTLDEKAKLPSIKNVRVGNSLISGEDKELQKYFGKNWQEKKPFNWEEQFPEVFAQGGFDVIIGNPPYVSVKEQDLETRQFIKNTYESSGGADLYVAFIERSLSLLKEGACLAFICPNKFFGADYGKKLREKLKRKFNIVKIWDLKDEKIFKDAMISTIVIIIRKEKQNGNVILKQGQEEKELANIFDEEGKLQIESNTESKKILSKISQNIKLSEIASIRTGIMGFEYWKMEKIIYSERESLNSVRLYTNGNMQRYSDLWDSVEINLYKKKYDRPFIKLDSSFLNKNTIEMFQKKPKIIVRGVSKKMSAIIDYSGSGLLVAVHSIIPNNLKDIRFILGVINSKFINWFHLNTFYSVRIPQGSLKYPISFLKSIPIPKKVSETNKAEVSKLVDKILDLNNATKNIPKNSDKWNSTKAEIAKTNKEIDQKVYELYGLTEEEIKIVEGK